MNHIPKPLNDELNNDQFYTRCCLRVDGLCEGKVERHHNLIFGAKQVQRKFSILPACKDYHHKYANRKDIKEKFDWVMWNRATDEEIAMFSKATDYQHYKKFLNNKYNV